MGCREFLVQDLNGYLLRFSQDLEDIKVQKLLVKIELYKVFNSKEIGKINAIKPIKDKDYSKDEINKLEHLILEE